MPPPDLKQKLAAHAEKCKQAEAAAQAKADAYLKDDNLAVSKGKTPEQIEARKRTARLFCEMHLDKDTPEEREARLALIDYTMTVMTVDARNKEVNNPPSAGFFGMGRKPAYFIATRFPPRSEREPIFALEYYPLKK